MIESYLLQNRADRRILFVDLNAFFASCEQAEDRQLWHRPVIVVPSQGSSAISVSYEAKVYGIRVGTSEREARFLCPGLVVRQARPKLYMDYHARFVALLEQISPRLTVRSVDEASLLLFQNEDPWQLSRTIKQQIWRHFGSVVNCSIGIAPNVFLAKLATELQKPNGLIELRLSDLPAIYGKVQLRDLCGINFRMERRLQRLGIYSVAAFYMADPALLKRELGVLGYRWWLQLHGYEAEFARSGRKSLSHSHVLPPEARSIEAAYGTLQRLTAKVGRRLRKNGCLAGRINLSIRFTDRTFWFAGRRITPCHDSLTLSHHLKQLWQLANPSQPILKLSIWTTDLADARGISQPLFPAQQRRLSMARALDKINDRYGADTIRFAIADMAGSRAPDRIAFSALFPIEHE